MSHSRVRSTFVPVLAGTVAALALGGCIYSSTERVTEKQVPATTPVVVAAATPERVVTYPEGRYQLYGDGNSVPYYWVWIPSGTTPPLPPAPPRLP
jgi:hypothetical protein